ncbi:MAG: M20/M25/M40 family metallo-hydrolase [Acidobacteria bacterium]|nr:M20/M25/M40 family metallo-hydrolase [Acidobacteriota bacterium]
MMTARLLYLTAAAAACVAAQPALIQSDWQAAINRIRPDSVRGHLSFLASDLLEGRATPSRGLDLAAEYIAAQFRRAGLEAPMGAGYFQSLNLQEVSVDLDGFECRLYQNGQVTRIDGIPVSREAIDIEREPLLPTAQLPVATRDAVIVYRGDVSKPQEAMKLLAGAGARLVIVLDPQGALSRVVARTRAIPAGRDANLPSARLLFVRSFSETIAPDARISVHARPTRVRPLKASNVGGLLRGSDPELAHSYLVISAHYDHVGMAPLGDGDRIFNGANDDASGVTALLEMAESFAQLPQRPRRSILFVAFAGEENGLLGAREFVAHPPVPVEQIVANLNFEHLGRPDADGASYIGKATMTGFGYTTMTEPMVAAARRAGFELFRHEKFSEPFYQASDNFAFAQRGIPAHTISNGFLFPEYHAVGDHWEKVDADNLAGLARALALGILTLADDGRAPQWIETVEKTEAFRKAAAALRR